MQRLVVVCDMSVEVGGMCFPYSGNRVLMGPCLLHPSRVAVRRGTWVPPPKPVTLGPTQRDANQWVFDGAYLMRPVSLKAPARTGLSAAKRRRIVAHGWSEGGTLGVNTEWRQPRKGCRKASA